MEKEVEVLFYKDISSNKVKVFINAKNESGKKFNLIKMQESRIDDCQFASENMKEHLMVSLYILLLQDGYQYTQILNEINKGIALSELENGMNTVISQLEDEKRYLEKAKIVLLKMDELMNGGLERLLFKSFQNRSIATMQSTCENDLSDIKHDKSLRR